MPFAHTHIDGRKEQLEAHLRLVAEGDGNFPGAAGFADECGARAWGRLLGLWHDLGKYSAEFQAYILNVAGADAHPLPSDRVDHSTAGAQHAALRFPGSIGRILARCIAGHHTGLLDDVAGGVGETGLTDRLSKVVPALIDVPPYLLEEPEPQPPEQMDFRADVRERAFRISVFCHMLFSCLVDADFLATEQFMSPQRSASRPLPPPPLSELRGVLDAHLARLSASADDTPVNRRRGDVLRQCRDKAALPPGLFSLTVPTGGGKTLSSLSFALEHAVRHGQRRVIYAIPFTSIIEQNAQVFRDVFAAAGEQVVLEHHSNFEPEESDDDLECEAQTPWHRLAAENWDAPLIVTTNVQLFESLFANKPSRCRKLHRVVRSVIILDEVQTLPVKLLRPTLAMLQELCRNYGCTVVTCSATMPAVAHRQDFPIGLEGVREIISDAPSLFAALKRVDAIRRGPLNDQALAEELGRHAQALCVVNTRNHAADLFRLLRDRGVEGVFHLSAQMCPAHRSDVLACIRQRLAASQPCRVVSTQLIEAGVDIDFPVVYRAMAGLDSIAQAAGRCNREGRLARGTVHVFEPEKIPPMFSAAVDETREVADLHVDVLGLDAIERYFQLHYWRHKDAWDGVRGQEVQIMDCFGRGDCLQFRTAAEAYRLIRDEQRPVIVPYGEQGRALIDELRRMRMPPSRTFLRRLQRYTVNLFPFEYARMIDGGPTELMQEQYCVLVDIQTYDSEVGLRVVDVTSDAERFIL